MLNGTLIEFIYAGFGYFQLRQMPFAVYYLSSIGPFQRTYVCLMVNK